MRKVNLTMKENNHYHVIKKLVDSNGKPALAAVKLNLSLRQVYRLIQGYKKEGKAFFSHKNKGKIPATKISNTLKSKVVQLYHQKYMNATYKHFSELLKENEKISISSPSLRAILKEAGFSSPRLHKSTRKRWQKELLAALEQPLTKKEKVNTLTQLQHLCATPHPKREKSKYFGELIQMDASCYAFLNDNQLYYLHLAVDDATGVVVGAYLDTQETLKGYFNVLNQILNNYGIPHAFLTDRRTVFEYAHLNRDLVEKDTFTQFSYACHQLGITIKTTSIPQAKGKIEKLNDTFQLRLPIELKVAGVSSIEEANTFLSTYLTKYNQKFALPVNDSKTVFEKQEDCSVNNFILSVLKPRVIARDHSIKYKNAYYFPINRDGDKVYFNYRTQCLVMECFDGKLCATVEDEIYLLEEIPLHKKYSSQFDITTPKKRKRRIYIPPMSHPWKEASFQAYLARKKQYST